MTNKEKALFLLSSLMNLDNKVETLKETIRLTVEAKNLRKDEFEDMIYIQLNFAQNWLSKEDLKEIGGLLMCILTPEAKECFGKIFKEITEEKAKKEATSLIAMNMIKKGFTIEDTSIATGLTKNQINQLCSSK